jgi:tetratricopeptide (TPR) repeat protein
MHQRIIQLTAFLAITFCGCQPSAAQNCVSDNWKAANIQQICTEALKNPALPAAAQAEMLFIRGLARSDKSPHDAVDDFEQGLHLAPDHHRMHRERARVAMTLGDYESFNRHVHLAVKLGPDNTHNFDLLSTYYHRTGNNKLALVAINRAVELQPGETRLKFRRLSLLMSTGKAEDAEPDAHWILAQPDSEIAKWPIAFYREANFPMRVAAKLALAKIFRVTNRRDQSIPLLEQAIAEYPTAQTYLESAVAQLSGYNEATNRQDQDAALRNLKESIRLDPMPAEAWLRLAMTHHGLGQLPDALLAIDTAIKLNAQSMYPFKAQWRRAFILRSLKRLPEAEKSAQLAISISLAKNYATAEAAMIPLVRSGYWKGELPEELNQGVIDAITACMHDESCF